MFDLKSLVRNFKEKQGVPLVPEDVMNEQAAEKLLTSLMPEEMFVHDPADTPFLASLPERYLRREEHSYSAVRTFLNNRGFESDELSEKDAQRFDVQYRISVSGLDEIPGYRRVVVLGHGFGSGHPWLITVNHHGRVDIHEMPAKLKKASMGVMLENRTGDVGVLDLNLNPRSSSVHDLCMEMPNFTGDFLSDETLHKKGKALSMFCGMRRAKLRKEMNIALWAIRESMDPEALRLMRSTHLTQIKMAAWLTGGQVKLTRDEETRIRCHEDHLSRYRKQAVKAYPLLAENFLMELTGEVDDGAPLVPLIEKRFSLSSVQVRMLNGLTWQKAGCSPFRTHEAIRNLRDAKAPPSKKAHFATLIWARWASINLIPEWGEWALPKKDAWRLTPHLSRLDQNAVTDMVEDLVRRVYLPTLLRVPGVIKEAPNELKSQYSFNRQKDVAKRICLKHLLALSPSELADSVERWHRNLRTYNDELDVASPKISWGSFSGSPLLGKIHGRELLSMDDLKDQGSKENHCVGGYLNSVLGQSWGGGHSLIFSLEKEGKVLSTVEMVVHRREKQGKTVFEVFVEQNHAKGNTTPTKEAQKAGEALAGRIRKMLNEQTWGAYLTGLEEARRVSEATDDLPFFVKQVGYDPRDDATFARAWNMMGNLLPRKVRKAGPEGLTSDFGNLSSHLNLDFNDIFGSDEYEGPRRDQPEYEDDDHMPF